MTEDQAAITIGASGSADVIECRAQIRGLYYNAQRGERLRPLDEKTARSL